jgi:hypothetical protein
MPYNQQKIDALIQIASLVANLLRDIFVGYVTSMTMALDQFFIVHIATLVDLVWVSVWTFDTVCDVTRVYLLLTRIIAVFLKNYKVIVLFAEKCCSNQRSHFEA